MDKIILKPSIGNNIKKLRVERKLTQPELVTQLELRGSNMSRGTLAKIEIGLRNIFVADLIRLKEIFNVDYEAFFEGIDPNEN